jgi:fumarate reductase subunit D
VVLLGLFVLMLVHSAHRFRYTLYDGLQIKRRRTTAVLCYGAAVGGSVAALVVLVSVL